MTYEQGANLVYGYLEYSVIQGIAELELIIQTMTSAGAGADAIRTYLLYDLENGGEFNWNWTANENENVKIKIHLFKSKEEDFGE